MSKFTRRFKKNKKNTTIKKGGTKHFENEHDEREGVFDIIKNNVANIASSAATTVADTGLKIIGLEKSTKIQKKFIPMEILINSLIQHQE